MSNTERSNPAVNRPTLGLHLGRGDVEGRDGEGDHDDHHHHHRGEVQGQRAGVDAGDIHVGLRG